MPADFTAIMQNLDGFAQTVDRAAERGAMGAAGILQAHARTSGRYRDASGATRAGTVAVVETRTDDGAALIAQAAQATNSRKRGSALVSSGPSLRPNELLSIRVTAMTWYTVQICTTKGGAEDFLSAAILEAGPRAVQVIYRTIRDAIAGGTP